MDEPTTAAEVDAMRADGSRDPDDVSGVVQMDPDVEDKLRAMRASVDELEAEPLGPDAFDKLTDEQAAELAPSLQLPMQTIVLAGAPLRVVKDPESEERAVIAGPIAFNFVLPLTKEAAFLIARDLTGGIEIASGLPADLKVVPS